MTTSVLVVAVFVGGLLVGVWGAARAVRSGADAPRTRAIEVPSDGWDVLAHELERGRRFERPFVLARLVLPAVGERSPARDELVEDVIQSMRAIDFVWVSDQGIDVLLPEVGRGEGEACVARLRTVLPDVASDIRLVSFPEDGVTRGSLLAALEGRPAALPDRADLPAQRHLKSTTRWAS